MQAVRHSRGGHLRDVGHHGGRQVTAVGERLLAQTQAGSWRALDDAAVRSSLGARFQLGLRAGQHFEGHDRSDRTLLLVVAWIRADEDGGAAVRTSGGGQGSAGGCEQQHAAAHEAFLHIHSPSNTVEERDLDSQLPLWGRWFQFEYSMLI